MDESREDRLRRMDDEIRALVAARGDRGAMALMPDVEAVMVRYGVNQPSTEGLLQWIDEVIAEGRTRAG